MFRSRLTAILQLSNIRMKLLPGVYGKQTCLQQPAGSARWSSSSIRPAPVLTAAPARALIDEQISIRGGFLPPHCPVTVWARMHSDEGDLWEAFAHYNTNASGAFSLSSDASVGGSYVGCEPMGLFWGMQPAPGGREGLRLRKRNVETPFVVRISLLEGHVSPGEGQTTELAAVTAERWYLTPGVKRTEIRQNGIVGTLFIPPGPGPFPAMLDMWGMGGGLPEYRASLFASRGYASLSLAYIGHKDLPGRPNCLTVGDSYFKAAFQLLQDHPQVVSDRVGIIGLCFGCYLTLRIAVQTGVKPSCLVCINGPVGGGVAESESEEQLPEQFKSFQKYFKYGDRDYISFKEVSLPSNLPLESIVKIEKIDCPLMYIVGEDDLSASSVENADVIEETLRAAGKSHLFTRLSYPGAGHLIEPPYAPNVRESMWTYKPKKLFTMWGGHPAPHAAAQEDVWKKILDFMETNLRC
ncbi:bile acid-CoA:amino acid N-acyltransferase-like [Kryptolebias marmoratus]|uniref:bile acid-CoA:amino acid N-acyltransferase-like n=1 Tax=Kryptolebias marmoratus TaxID=37003 RepID=UPI0007F90EED|nr:bile acid-CoA:amino acid N-acyltransferase-like [Kryptolebias marmoratus]